MEQKLGWQAPITVLFWAILQLFSSHLMHTSVKTLAFFSNSSASPGICFIFTLVEIIILLAIIKIEIPKQNKAILEGAFIGYFSHFSATFFQNFLNSSSSSTNSNVVLISFSLQPLLSLILVRLFLGIMLPAVQIAALLILTIGALGTLFFSGLSTHMTQQDVTIVIAMAILFICRNIAMKHIYLENINLQTRWDTRIILFIVSSCLLVGMIGSFYSSSLKPVLFQTMIAASIHVVSTFLILTNFIRKYNIVMVAIFSMLAQFLCQTDAMDIFILFRNVKLFFSVSLCVCGIIIYIMSTFKYAEQSECTVRPNDRYTRLEFTVFIAIIITLFNYTLPLKVSPRDIKNFKYFGFKSVL